MSFVLTEHSIEFLFISSLSRLFLSYVLAELYKALFDSKFWKPLETLEEAVARKERLKNRNKNPRTDYVNDGKGIGENYSRFLEKFELSRGSTFLL